MSRTTRELHLLPVAVDPGRGAPAGAECGGRSCLRLKEANPGLVTAAPGPRLADSRATVGVTGIRVESFVTPNHKLRLFAWFPLRAVVQVNGELAPHYVILAPNDFVRWDDKLAFFVMSYHRPQVGPPPAEILGTPCPVCRVPFAVTTMCVACVCGTYVHCEADEKEGLQCAQLRRECPVCHRLLDLNEGYDDPPTHEDES